MNDEEQLSIGQRPFMNRFISQTVSLTKKNLVLQYRNKTATCVQVFIGVVFLLLLLVMDVAIRANSQGDDAFTAVYNRREVTTLKVGCTVGPGKDKCYSFIYAPTNPLAKNDVEIEKVINALLTLQNLPLERDVKFGVIGLESATKVNEYILANANMTKAAILFDNSNIWTVPGSTFRYTIQVNSTEDCGGLGILGCTNNYRAIRIPLQTALDAAFISVYGSPSTANTANISVSFADYPHPGLKSSFDVVAEYGAAFLYIAITFNYVIQLSLLVQEKELHLVEAMKQIGMIGGAYWLSWVITNTIVNTIMVGLLVLFGFILGFEVFIETDPLLMITFLWLTATAFTFLAFLFSSFTRSTATARLIGIGVFILSFIAAPIMMGIFFSDPDTDYDSWRTGTSLFPMFGFYGIMDKLIKGSSGSLKSGIKWDERSLNFLPVDSSILKPPSWSIETSFIYMVYSIIMFSFFTWYFEAVIPTEYGRAQPLYFFLLPSYWGCRRSKNHQSQKMSAEDSLPVSFKGKELTKEELDALDIDVREEAEKVHNRNFAGRDPAVIVDHLSKHFGRFKAVDRVSYAIDKDQCFVILGHNGAGKSTTFNMLTGLTHVTDGDAKIFGLSVRDDMATLHSVMGVCPQHDILWDQLTGREHLRMFANLKGIPKDQIENEVNTRLTQVNLIGSADVPTQGYSGGMKRRLSISIALIGNPRIVFLDEPTTGMDPVSRREVWDMIAAAKKGRVIVLTTHSMEEADVLGDRIGVMSHGKLQAVGSSLRLKKRFGKGYRLTMFVASPSAEAKLTAWIKSEAPKGTDLASSVQGALLYQLPRQDDPSEMIEFFKKFETVKESLGVSDYSVSLSTLEEVFLTLSEKDNFITSAELITKRRKSSTALSKQQQAQLTVSIAGMPQELPKDNNNVLSNQPLETRKIGQIARLRALTYKTGSYQFKQKLSCFGIVSFPLFIMFALVALDRALLTNLKVEAMCGKGVLQKDCAKNGTDLTCAENALQSTFVSTPTIQVGEIQTFFRGGPGINPNCGPSSCYGGLEKPDYRKIPTTSVSTDIGSLKYSSTTEDLFNLQANIYFSLQNSSCTDTYNAAFDSNEACKDFKTSSEKISCQKNVTSLIIGRDWVSSNTTTIGQSSFGGLGACQKDSTTGTIAEPSQEILDKLTALSNAKTECSKDQNQRLFRLFDDVDVPSLVAASTKSSSGIFNEYTSTTVQDSIMSSFSFSIFSSIVSTALQNPAAIPWYVSKGKNPQTDSVTFSEMCEVSSPFYPLLLVVVENDVTRRTRLCSWATNQDIIRQVGFEVYASTKKLDEGIYAGWFGRELQTQYMKDRSVYLTKQTQYRERHVFSHVNGYDFSIADSTKASYKYVAYYNNTATSASRVGNWIANVMLMDNALVKFHTGHSIETRTKSFPRKFKCNRDSWLNGTARLDCPSLLGGFLALSILDFVGLGLFPYLFLMHSFVIVSLIVYEKETKLLMIMKMMGMDSGSYWLVTYLWFLVQWLIMFLFIYIIALQAGVNTFGLHDPIVVWFFAFSWANCLIAYSFLLSIFFASSRTSTAAVFLSILIFNTVFLELVQTLVQDPNATEAQYASIMWLPPTTMIRVCAIFGLSGAFNEKIPTAKMLEYVGGGVARSLLYMWIEWAACLFLVWYLDKVWVAGFGVRLGPLFFLDKKYWFGGGADLGAQNLAAIPLEADIAASDFEERMGEDCKKEHERVIDLSSDAIVRIVRLNKRYPNGKLAVKALSLGINRNECFCLLGHNGAGKTTTINMMCGLFENTAGTATVDGYSIKTDMSSIQARSGVCVQENILWDTLSCRDHVLFFGRLKGLTGSALSAACDQALKDVNLKQFENRRSGALSGGMKRRLSVANALIGNPKVVYLDEPSTGLDPASRRQLWDVISNAKGNKSIVLTTHSMEEAEILSDRVGIMALGELQCVGSSAELCRRYGAGYTFFVSVDERTTESYAKVEKFVLNQFPSAKLLEEPIGGTSKFEVKREEVVLSRVFELMENSSTKKEYGINNWGLSETTLEEVFLHLSEESHVSEKLAVTIPATSMFSLSKSKTKA